MKNNNFWLLGKNKFIKPAASSLHGLAVGEVYPRHRR